MANINDKLTFLNDHRQHPENYLPLVDHAQKTFASRDPEYGEVNVGWDTGVIEGNRPYFCECWAEGYTVLTYYVSTSGIETYSVEQIEAMLKSAGIVWYVGERKYPTSVRKFFDNSGNEFFSINIIVGDDDGTYIDGGIIFSFRYLNNYNSK